MKIRTKSEAKKFPLWASLNTKVYRPSATFYRTLQSILFNISGNTGKIRKKSKGSKNRRGKPAVGKKRIDDFQNARAGRKELSRRQLLSARERKSVKVENPEKRERIKERCEKIISGGIFRSDTRSENFQQFSIIKSTQNVSN